VAAALDIPESHVRVWEARNSIPADRWPEVVGLANSLGVSGITLEKLAELLRAKRTVSA
jgi:hypothetical protein